jgi:hypothetical protein
MKTWSWEYFSFLKLDQAMAYKEILFIPILVLVLSVIWMQLVKGEKGKTEEETKKEGIDIVQAYQDVLMNEVDSGTELDSPDEDEGKDDKKDDSDKEEEKNKDD